MENPKARLTNVHRVEGISTIHWLTYVQDDSRGLDDSHDALKAAERQLRAKSQYVLYEYDPAMLWHFVLSGTGISREKVSEQLGQVSAILTRLGLKRNSSGSLKSNDINAATKLLQRDTVESIQTSFDLKHGVHVDFSTTGMMQSRVDLQDGDPTTSDPHKENFLVCLRATAAIERSVAHVLFSQGIWLPVGSTVFISRPVLDSQLPMSMDALPSCMDESPLLYSLKVTWLSNGTMLLFCTAVSPQAILKSPYQGDSDDRGLIAVLSPLGLKAQISKGVKELDTWPQDVQSSISQWKNIVVEWLVSQDIKLESSDQWSLVKLSVLDYLNSESSFQQAPNLSFLWPTELCCLFPPSLKMPAGEPQIFGSDDVRDFLAEAEAWKANKDQRAKAVQVERLEKKRQSLSGEEQDERDDFIHLFPKNDGMLDVQTMTGMYPTPPDARPQGHGSGEDRHENQSFRVDAKTPGEAETKTPKVMFDETADGLEMDAFDHLDEDDLFGALQGDDYGNNGVTEDDFSFFDEPGDTPMENAAGQLSTEHIEIAEANLQLSESPEIHEKAEKLAINDDFSESAGPSRPQTSAGTVEQAQLTPAVDGEQMDWQRTPEDTAKSWEGDVKKGAGFNTKYGSKGKFSTDASGPQSTNPSRGPAVRNQIPNLSQVEHISDSEDESDSDVDVSYESTAPGIDVRPPDNRRKAPNESPVNSVHTDHRASSNGDKDLQLIYDLTVPKPGELMERLMQIPSVFKASAHRHRRHVKSLPTNLDQYVRLAQIFADQMVYYRIPVTGPCPQDRPVDYDQIQTDDPAYSAIKSLFPREQTCDVESFIAFGEDVGDINLSAKAANRQQLKRTDTGKLDQSSVESIIPIHPPNIRTRRGEKQMEISYVALRFWEHLGLSPTSGPKNILAFCMFPDREVVRHGVKSFLTMMNSTYSSLRLGTHDIGHAAMKGWRDGLISVPTSDDISRHSLLVRTCEKLGRALQTLATQRATIVLYIINDQDQAGGVRNICSAFKKLWENYASNLRFTSSFSDVVLKVLPMNWVASSWNIAIPSVKDLVLLSKEIYDRCPLGGDSASPYASHSLVEIAEPIPKSLDFKLTPESQTNPFHRETYAHVAYCWDLDSAWITASLTDTLGCHSWSASFSTGRTADKWPIFRAVTKEIAEIVKESIEDSHGRVRLVVSKDSSISAAERECWTDACDEPLILMTIDASPGLFLLPGQPVSAHLDSIQMLNAVPSTPDVSSPDPNTTKFGDDLDPNARAVDLDEESWALITSRTLDLERNLDVRSLVPHGYLIKRNRAVLGLQIVHADAEVDVRELLTMTQGLICLAKARGLEGELPCHMAFARKAQDCLFMF